MFRQRGAQFLRATFARALPGKDDDIQVSHVRLIHAEALAHEAFEAIPVDRAFRMLF